MKRIRLAIWASTAAIVFAMLTLVPAGHAQLRRIELRVDGLACPFCAYGLEKNLKAVKGVQDLKIDLDEGKLTLLPKEGEFIPVSRLYDAVKDGGFTPRELRIVVAGQVFSVGTLASDKEAIKALDGIRELAHKQGITLPQDPLVLKTKEPTCFLLLLEHPDKDFRQAFEQLRSSLSGDKELVITGFVPSSKKKTKQDLFALYVMQSLPADQDLSSE